MKKLSKSNELIIVMIFLLILFLTISYLLMPLTSYHSFIVIVLILTISLLICINHSENAKWLRNHKKQSIAALIFIIITINIISVCYLYSNITYTSYRYSTHDLTTLQLENQYNNSINIHFAAYFHSEGPMAANNEIILDQIHFYRCITDYTGDSTEIHIKNTDEIIDLTSCTLTLTFQLSTSNAIGEAFTISIPSADTVNKSEYYIPAPEDTAGKLEISAGDTVIVHCWGRLTTNDNEEYGLFDDSEIDTFNLWPTSEYFEYKNSQITMAMLIIAAITFSLPAAIKTISGLYWGKEENEVPIDKMNK